MLPQPSTYTADSLPEEKKIFGTFFVFFLYLRAAESNTTSDWLNHTM